MANALPQATTSLTPSPAVPLTPRPLLAASTLAWREVIRFFRQRNRVIGSIATPLMFWLLFGMGLQSSFQLPGSGGESPGYLAYSFPGSLMLMVLFTSIFSSISIIEDRREGFLQAVLIAPIPRWSMVLGKVLGGVSVAMLQSLLFLGIAVALRRDVPLGSIALAVPLLFVISLGLSSLGFALAWKMDSTQGFHAVMNLLLMPMWLLSGAFFPVTLWTEKSGVGELMLGGLMRANPLSYGMSAVHRLLLGRLADGVWQPDMAVCVIVSIVFAGLCFGLAVRMSSERTTGDLL